MKKQEETVEECIARHMAANENLTEEAARAKCEGEQKSKEAPDETKSFMEKLIAVFEESMETKMNEFTKRIDDRMNQIAKQKEDEAVEALRKGLGLNKDPVVHLSEIEGMVRKILLEESPHGKRTETETTDKPTEGTETLEKGKAKIPSSEELWKKVTKDRMVV